MSAAAQGDYVAGVLRDMYGGGALPRAATQLLRDRCKARSSSAPPARTWSNSASEGRAERKRVDLRVPRVGRGRGSEEPALPPRMPAGRRPHAAIVRETANYCRLDERPQQLGRDNDAERQWLADRRYMGAAAVRRAASEAPRASPRRVSFEAAPGGEEPAPRRAGLDGQQERLAAEIVEAVRDRQRQLDKVEQDLASCAACAEQPGVGHARRAAARKQADSANKARLELRNAIGRDVKDLETLLSCTPGG